MKELRIVDEKNRHLPKIEHHCRLEGVIPWETLYKLAESLVIENLIVIKYDEILNFLVSTDVIVLQRLS